MNVDFEMVQGDSRYIEYTCFNEDGSPLDLSTASDMTWGFIRYGDFNSNTIITKSLGSGIIISGVNVASVKLDPADTVGVHGKFEHTFKLEDFGNDVFSENGLFVINISSL